MNEMREKNNKKHYIGARFTSKEKGYINKFAKQNDYSLSTLLREALFSHINLLKQSNYTQEKFILIPIKNKKRKKR